MQHKFLKKILLIILFFSFSTIGNGISAMKWYDVLGTNADKNYKEDELI